MGCRRATWQQRGADHSGVAARAMARSGACSRQTVAGKAEARRCTRGHQGQGAPTGHGSRRRVEAALFEELVDKDDDVVAEQGHDSLDDGFPTQRRRGAAPDGIFPNCLPNPEDATVMSATVPPSSSVVAATPLATTAAAIRSAMAVGWSERES